MPISFAEPFFQIETETYKISIYIASWKKIYPKMNQLIPDLSYLHNDNSCTDFGDGYSLLRCRPEAMPHSLTTRRDIFADRILTWNRCTIGWTSMKRHWSWSKLQHLGLQKFITRTLILKNFLWVQSWRFYNLAMIVLLNWKPYYPPAFKPLSIIDLQNMITKNYLQVFRGTIIFNLFCV